MGTVFFSESFTQILPFDEGNPLEAGVQSDHAEIALKTSNHRVINSWNISNPAHHSYFKYGDNPPFYKMHLFTRHPFIEGVMDEKLAAKSQDQIKVIAERFVKGDVNIQIIVEGYESFYKDLAEKINELGSREFQIISLLNEKPKEWKPELNVTAILIDTSKFLILNSGVVHKKYQEEQDGNEDKDLYLPFAHVMDKDTKHSMVIVGVHVKGCGSQYPKSGLETLALAISELQKDTLGNPDVIAVGDFNAPPMHVRKSVADGVLLKAPYPTHVNPKSEAGNYDQVVILRGTSSETYEVLPADQLSIASQKLIASIERSRQKCLM